MKQDNREKASASYIAPEVTVFEIGMEQGILSGSYTGIGNETTSEEVL